MTTFFQALLSSVEFEIFARIILTSFFWIAGIFGVLKFQVMVNTIRLHGLPGPKFIVMAMIATEIGGSLLLISNYNSLGWVGAGWLGIFTFLSIPLGHPFWKFEQPRKMEEMQVALEHIAVIGGLMAAAALSVN